MKDEVSVAVRFLTRLIEKSNLNVSNGIEKEQLEVFKDRLGELLCKRFRNHWFPENPARGQGYRCIRLNESDRKDTVIDQAAAQCGLSYEQLRLPTELTIWVDPKEVCCRFGEHQGSFCTLASFKSGHGEIFLDQVNLEEIHRKTIELKEKVVQEMSTRKNGRKGFLSNGSSPNNYKGSRFNNGNGYIPHHHSHHGHGGLHHSNHSPSPAAVSWYNSVNSSNHSSNTSSNNSLNNSNHNQHQQQQQHLNHSSSADMFSTSPPNYFSSLAKFSPPKYGYGTSSKWSTPAPHPSYGLTIPSSKGDKYHWFNSNKATIKA